MKVAIIYDKFREDTLGEHYKKALIQAGHAVEHFWLKDSRQIEPVFDIYLRVDDGDYKYDIPHKRLAPSFFYASDTHLKKPFSEIKRIARFYDHVFCAQYSGYLKLRYLYGGKASWLPHACDAGLHRDLGMERKLDIAFVGNDGGNPRKFILQELRERFPNSYIGGAHYTDIARIYSMARIGFNYSIANDINMRMFEVMGCGAMLLTNHIEDNGFSAIFGDTRALAAYGSPKEMFSLLDYYLRNETERKAIAEAGKKMATEGHTYAKRAFFLSEAMRRYA